MEFSSLQEASLLRVVVGEGSGWPVGPGEEGPRGGQPGSLSSDLPPPRFPAALFPPLLSLAFWPLAPSPDAWLWTECGSHLPPPPHTQPSGAAPHASVCLQSPMRSPPALPNIRTLSNRNIEETGIGVNEEVWPPSLDPTFGHHGPPHFHPSGPHVSAFFSLRLDLLTRACFSIF